MSRVMLDTSAYVAFMRGHPGIQLVLQQAEEIYVNAVVLGELLAGFKKGKQEKKNLAELRIFLESPRMRVVNVDADTAERYAVILSALQRLGSPIPTNDIWIAASAMQYGLNLLTTDGHYQSVSQVVVEYFERS